ncbi:MAG: amidohydrolase family protein [Bacteroidota bacterium]|nr:amidohydrolase family protein [Bacteroidota bacterium]
MIIIKSVFFVLVYILISGKILAQQYDYCIHDVSVITAEKATPLHEHQDVFLRKDKIAKISASSGVTPKNCRTVIDGTGKFLMPGLTDMHVHLPSEHIEKFMLLNLAAGVTTIRSMRGKYSHIELKKNITSGKMLGPDLYIASTYFPNKNITIDRLADSIQGFKNAGFDFVKVLAVPDSLYFEALMKAAKKAGLPVVGHAPNHVSIERVIESDYACIEHLQGLDDAFITDSNTIPALVEKMKEHNTYNCPTLDYYNVFLLQVPVAELQKRPGLDFMDKQTVAGWTKDLTEDFAKFNQGSGDTLKRKQEKRQRNMEMRYRLIKQLNDLGAKMILSPAEANDPFGVPGFCVWEEMKLFSRAGISNKDILRIATYNAADFFHESDSWGSIAEGKKANLLLLDRNPLESIENIQSQRGVFLAGKYYEPKTLEAMMKD